MYFMPACVCLHKMLSIEFILVSCIFMFQTFYVHKNGLAWLNISHKRIFKLETPLLTEFTSGEKFYFSV